MQGFKKLEIWQLSYQLSLDVYRISEKFPHDETYGLRSQLRRASTSIPINIAEGFGYDSVASFSRFIRIAIGSAEEVDCELLLCRDLGYISPETQLELSMRLNIIKRKLVKFKQRLKASNRQPITDNRQPPTDNR